MEFSYRNHTITIKDKIVEYFTGMIEPTVTDLLFDVYFKNTYGFKGKNVEELDLSRYSDEELSKAFEARMLEECELYFEIRGAWKEELRKSE